MKRLVLAAVTFIVFLTAGYVLAQGSSDQVSPESEHSHWVCPMHPTETSVQQGDCEICGMAMVKNESVDHSHDEHWVCPMHPEETSDSKGRCPICKMFLVKGEVANHTHSEASGEHWVCPMHPEETSDSKGRCPICKMFLVKDESSEHAHSEASGERWVCPMHPEETSDSKGRCPICKMYLVKEGATDSEHEQVHDLANQGNHKHVHEPIEVSHSTGAASSQWICPMHPQIKKDKEGSCPICGMDLVEKEVVASVPAEKVLDHWTCPMHPQIKRDSEGSCPICGMDLVPKYKESGAREQGGVRISPAVENNLGVKTATVVRTKLSQLIETVGYVQFNENSLNHIHSRVEGWIEKLNVNSIGDPVREGQVLFEIFAPDLVNAQEEYVTALNSGNKKLIAASRQRLALLGVSEGQIKTLSKTRKVQQRLAIMAERNGYVSDLNVRKGMFVKPATEIMATGDLESVWVIAEVFERQAAWLKTGQAVTMQADSYPGREWHGSVEYIYPVLNQQSRTLEVRIQFDNSNETLKPNMFANITIHAGDDQTRLNIPRSALIRGGRYDRVVKALGDGHYKSVLVEAGFESGDRVEILKGLDEDDQVVTAAQFMIDSESNLDAEMARMEDPEDHSHRH